MAGAADDSPLNDEEISILRQRLASMSITGLRDAYYAAWTRCKLEHGGPPPKARFVQELVQAWRELRRVE